MPDVSLKAQGDKKHDSERYSSIYDARPGLAQGVSSRAVDSDMQMMDLWYEPICTGAGQHL